jgi:uncharacterized integral membrane protein
MNELAMAFFLDAFLCAVGCVMARRAKNHHWLLAFVAGTILYVLFAVAFSIHPATVSMPYPFIRTWLW